VAVLPGSHVVTLVATAMEADKRASRIGGRVEFSAEAAHLYSIRVCGSAARKLPSFWVRDEGSLACVSSLCPTP
jgi:hypothetical protein